MALRSCFSIISTYYIDMADDKKDQFHTNEHGVLLHNTIEESGENIQTIFDYSGDIDSFIDWVKEKSIKVKRIEERYDDVENVYEIYSDKGTSVVGLTYYRSVMIIRSPKDDTMIDDYLGKDDVARISHGKEEFTIRDGWTKITAKCETLDSAIYDKEAELLPGTDYEFYLDKKLIAKFTMYYKNSEMDDVNPTIEDFEIEEEMQGKGYKKMIVRAIEKRLGRQGFSKIWLTNYIGYPPPSDFWLKIGYKFDIDEGYRSLKKYKLKPLPKDFKKLESEVWKMVCDEDDEAIELLERFPENDQIIILKANTLNLLGRHEEALECIDNALTTVSDKSDLLKEKANALNGLGRLEETIKCIDLIKPDDNYSEHSLWLVKAEVLEQLGRYEEAFDLYEKIMEIEDDKDASEPFGYENERWDYVDKLNNFGRHEKAIKLCDEAGEEHSLALEKKTESLEQLGRYEEAIKCIGEAISVESENENYYSLGKYYGKKAELLNLLGRHEEALECLDEGIEKGNLAKDGKYFSSSEYHEALFYHLLPHKAKSLKQLGRYEEALECCEKGIDILNLVEWGDSGGDVKDFWNTKMESLQQLGRYEEGEKCSDKADPIPFYKKRNPRQKTLFWR